MKKKVVSIILIGMMMHSVYACGSIASEEAEDTLSNSEVQQATDGENAEPIYIIEPELTQDDTNREYFDFRWEGAEVPEAVYEQKLKEVFDKEQSMEPENFVSLEEMLSLFQM